MGTGEGSLEPMRRKNGVALLLSSFNVTDKPADRQNGQLFVAATTEPSKALKWMEVLSE